MHTLPVQISIPCPLCEAPLDPKKNPGVLINRKATLRSQLISLKAQLESIQSRKSNSGLESAVDIADMRRRLKDTIEASERELRILDSL